MNNSGGRSERRREPLSAPRIVQGAIEILDAKGAEALTFRALAEQLSTGPGALYHHVTNRDMLLEGAAAKLVADAVDIAAAPAPSLAAPAGLRPLVLAVYDLIGAHPWLGPQLARAPRQTAVLLIFEAIGERLSLVDMPNRCRVALASALVHYLLGAVAHSAADTPSQANQGAMLREATQERLSRVAGAGFPFMDAVAGQLLDHDDRAQFAAGIDLLLTGASVLPRDRLAGDIAQPLRR